VISVDSKSKERNRHLRLTFLANEILGEGGDRVEGKQVGE
jgi:hypothetical protein